MLKTPTEKELLDDIDKAQEKESEWYHEGMRLKAIYKQLFKKEA